MGQTTVSEDVNKINALRERAMVMRDLWGSAHRGASQLYRDRVERRLLRAGDDGERALMVYEVHDTRLATVRTVGYSPTDVRDMRDCLVGCADWNSLTMQLVGALTILRGWCCLPPSWGRTGDTGLPVGGGSARERALVLAAVAEQVLAVLEQEAEQPIETRAQRLAGLAGLVIQLPVAREATWVGGMAVADQRAERILRGGS